MYAFRGQNYSGNTEYRRGSWKSALCVLSMALLSVCSFASAAKDGNSVDSAGKSIVFNGWYHSSKEKWTGPYHDKMLFTWYTVRTVTNSLSEYKRLVAHQREHGVEFIGCSYSSVLSAPTQYIDDKAIFPEVTIPREAIKDSWILEARGEKKDIYVLDIGREEVQDAILLRVVSNAKSLGANALFLDNWGYKSWAPAGQTIEQWAQKNLAFIIRARELTNQYNLKLIVNQNSPLNEWPVFAPYLDGFSYELSTKKACLQKKEQYKLELDTYEKMMAAGKSIFLVVYGRLEGNWDLDGRKIAATAMLVMPENQPHWGGIYVCSPIYEVWPVGGWAMWPEQLGKPLGPRKWEGDTVTRNFEHGSIAVTTGDQPKFSITINY